MSDLTLETLAAAVASNRALPLAPVPLSIGTFTGDVGEPQQPSLLPGHGGGLGGSGSSIPHPFKVYTRTTPGDTTLDRLVALSSRVLKTIAGLAELSVTGIAGSDIPDPSDSEWKLFTAGDRIWLEVAYSGLGVATGASIKSFGNGDTWPDFDPGTGDAQCLVEWTGDGTSGDPFIQTKSRAIIARTYDDLDGIPHLIQVAHSDFLLAGYDVDGKVMELLVPICGGV